MFVREIGPVLADDRRWKKNRETNPSFVEAAATILKDV
jgi:hypothetical protein